MQDLILKSYSNELSMEAKHVDVFPIVKHYIEALKIHETLNEVIVASPQHKLKPAQVLCTLITNIVISKCPLYKIEQWVSKYFDGNPRDMSEEASLYNDDCCARTLDKLYEADRNTLLTKISAKAIEVHQLELKQINNDSTSISFAGAYDTDTDDEVVDLTYGFSKDHRPDDKQIVFGLSITADGHVPIKYDLFDGNRTDDTTHIDNWNGLRQFIGNTDFVYIADSKLCTVDNLNHIASNGGRFITILPKNRVEVKDFHKKLNSGWNIPWQEEYKIPSSRKKGEDNIYKLYEGDKTSEGYRVIWVFSSIKAAQDIATRNRRIQKAKSELEELQSKLNRYHLKSKEQIEKASNSINKHGLLSVSITEHKSITQKQSKRGKPTVNTKYVNIETTTFSLDWQINQDAFNQDKYSDGIFPLISNTTDTPTEVLKRYKTQPFLEKRFQTSKSVLKIAPVFLKKPKRIEAMMFLYFIALMIVSLIERNIRKELKATPTELRILPENRNASSPTWNNIKEFFSGVCLRIVKLKQEVVAKLCGLSTLHKTILNLIKVPVTVYSQLQDNWWNFELTG